MHNSNYLANIWSKWKNNESPCDKCPNNDINNYWYPFYGLGNHQSSIMVIADTPAYNIEGMEYRTQKNAHDYHQVSDDFNQVVSSHLNERFQSSTNKLIEILKYIADSTSLEVQDLYFTNAKKCGDIPNSKHLNNQARSICGNNFLYEEIKTVSPQLVFTIGSSPFKLVKSLFNINASNSIIQNHCKVFFNKTNSIYFITLAHWGYFRRNNILENYYKDIESISQKIIKYVWN